MVYPIPNIIKQKTASLLLLFFLVLNKAQISVISSKQGYLPKVNIKLCPQFWLGFQTVAC